MNALVRKEFRLILPAWTVALVALATGPVVVGAAHPVSVFTFWLSMVALGLAPFGREFSSGSFSSLLSQPFPRERLWRAKVRQFVLAACSLLCLSVFLWADEFRINGKLDWELVWIMASTGLAMMSGGLWTTMLLRQTTAAFWITLLVPAALAFSTSLVTEWLLMLANSLMLPTPRLSQPILAANSAVFVLYSIAGYWWARRLFLRAQDVGWWVAEAPVQGSARWFRIGTRPGSEPSHHPLRALAIKELQLHSLSLFFAAGVLVLHLAAIGARRLGGQSSAWWGPATIAFVFWFILPLIAGAEAVASERQLGTMEGQLCLPARRRTQFALKLLLALVAGVMLGAVMPWLLEHTARAVGIASELETNWTALYWFSAFATLLALISFYASSLTRNTLQALGGALVAVTVVWMLADWVRPDVDGDKRLWRWGLAHLIGGPSLAATLLGLSYWNFKRLHQAGQLWRRNLIVLGVWLAFTVVVTPLVYHRTWELVLPLEPQHGPARISSGGRAELCYAPNRAACAYILRLPDGRIWAGTEGDFVSGFRLSGGKFLEGSNWVVLASTFLDAVAIKADGSLWTVLDYSTVAMTNGHLAATLKPPQRIGTDSDWRSLSAHGWHILALKQDGSIWGWGNNSHNQLGEGPKQFTNGPLRIGAESDWTAVFASGRRSAAAKRDGSVWMWGGLYNLPDGTRLKEMLRQPTPMRWNLPGTNLVSFHWIWTGELALYGDGSAWAVGRIPPGLLHGQGVSAGDDDADWLATAPAVVTPVRVNQGEGWRAVALGQFLVMIHGNGSLWESTDFWSPRKSYQPRKVSKYSDWVALAAQEYETYALAADGTLCCWTVARPDRDPRALLGPTRGPLWSLNIFNRAK